LAPVKAANFCRNSGKNGELKLQHANDPEPVDLADGSPSGQMQHDMPDKKSMEAIFFQGPRQAYPVPAWCPAVPSEREAVHPRRRSKIGYPAG
jgi:hypothetical protein